MTVKSECDYWNSHSDAYKATIYAQWFFGLLLAAATYWSYTHNPAGSVNSTVPVLMLLDYVCICWALNSQRDWSEKSVVSENFSEFWRFGFFKGDDFLAGIIFGWLGAALCTYGIYSSLVLHDTIPISLDSSTKSAPVVVRSAPAPAKHVTVVHHSAHKTTSAHSGHQVSTTAQAPGAQ